MALGASSKSLVVKDLSYLVTNNPQSDSAKKAREFCAAIIDEEQFPALLANPFHAQADGIKEPVIQGELF